MSKRSLIIIGAGGLGRELAAWIRKLEHIDLLGFVDDDKAIGSLIDGLPVLSNVDGIEKNIRENNRNFVVAIGNPKAKQNVVTNITRVKGITFPVLIHPAVIMDDPERISLGEGSVITAGCILTTGIQIGKHVLINLNTTIGHDTTLGDCTSLMPSVKISGMVTVGNAVLVGTGAAVINRVSIGSGTVVGAGTVVLKDLPEDCTAVGVPAKILKRSS